MINTRTNDEVGDATFGPEGPPPTIPQLISALEAIYDKTVGDSVLAPVTRHLKHALAALRGLRALAHVVSVEADDEKRAFGGSAASGFIEM